MIREDCSPGASKRRNPKDIGLGTSGITLKEADIQRTICDFLRAEQWRVFEFENEWSERKKKLLGEEGMPDVLAIRYVGEWTQHPDPPQRFCGTTEALVRAESEVLWLECKRIDKRGRLTKPTPAQKDWKLLERKRGALVWTLGEECEPSFEGFKALYGASELQRR